MQSGSQSTSPLGHPSHAFANIIGTAIALITLVTPLVVIAHYTPEIPPTPAPERQLE